MIPSPLNQENQSCKPPRASWNTLMSAHWGHGRSRLRCQFTGFLLEVVIVGQKPRTLSKPPIQDLKGAIAPTEKLQAQTLEYVRTPASVKKQMIVYR
jgi:hypothetical protein